jgi:hypothetical protein
MGDGMGEGTGVPKGLLRLDPAAETDAEADLTMPGPGQVGIPVDAARALRCVKSEGDKGWRLQTVFL